MLIAAMQPALAQQAAPDGRCGEIVTVPTHGGTTTLYSFLPAKVAAPQSEPVTLVMLIGGGGYMDLDDKGCARLLSRNVLIRMRTALQDAGVASALVDASSDLRTDEGLGGFRIAAEHADDLAKVIADIRTRSKGPVWIAGHSRGSISAANAAARLPGAKGADGVILLSAMLSGDAKARRLWAAHTVFSTDLDAIRIPLLIVGHAADNCVRSPPDLMNSVTTKTSSARRQAATVTGGPIAAGRPVNLAACEVREPHDFVGQETEVAAGIVRFMGGGVF
jgi:hypothetical protein